MMTRFHWSCCGGLVGACEDKQDDLRVSGGLSDAVALVRDSLDSGEFLGVAREQLRR